MVAFDVPLQGDSEAGVVEILQTNTALTTAFPTLRVTTDLVGYSAGMHWVEVARKGGNSSPWQKVDKPRIDFYIYADTRANAHDIGQLVLKAMFEAQTNYVGKGIRLQVVKVESGLTRVPDKFNDAARFVLSLRLTVTPE